jgi:hypothetical protein
VTKTEVLFLHFAQTDEQTIPADYGHTGTTEKPVRGLPKRLKKKKKKSKLSSKINSG